MGAERIDGIKYNVDRLTDEEVLGINGHLLERHRAIVEDIEKVAGILATRGLVSLDTPEDGQERLFTDEELFRVDL